MISPQYPAMEAAFGAVAALVVWRFGVNAASLCYLGFFLALLLMAWVDWKTMYIFDVTTVPLAAGGILVSWFLPQFFLSPFDSLVAAIEMLAVMMVLAMAGQAWYKREVVGGGDLKLMAAGAAFLGTRHAWKSLALGILLGLPLLLLYLRMKGLGRRDPAPLGPGLALGLAVTAWNMIGGGSLDPYLDLVGLGLLKVN